MLYFFDLMAARRASIFLVLVLAAVHARAGTVSGRVILVKDGKELADASNAVVWIEGMKGAAPNGHAGEMKSSQKRFQPRVVAVPAKGTVEFPNADPIYHNVFSVSGDNRFDLGLYRSGASKSKTFDEPGLVRVYCNIHPQMVGFVMVVDSDFAVVTERDGSFKFEGVPAGPHAVRVWHEEGPEAKETVTVGTGASAPLTIRIDVSGFKPESHKNKYGKDYKPPPPDSEDERY
jgi:plastocyanin